MINLIYVKLISLQRDINNKLYALLLAQQQDSVTSCTQGYC